MTSWSRRKNGLIRKIRLISQFMMSQRGYQTITIHILFNVSRSKGYQTLKLGQVVEYNKRNKFLQNSYRKWDWETSSRLLFVFWKNATWDKSKQFAAQFQSLSIVFNLANKNKIKKTLECRSRDMLHFDFLKNGLGLDYSPHFMHDLSRKMFLKF